jgi:hypothetical protein
MLMLILTQRLRLPPCRPHGGRPCPGRANTLVGSAILLQTSVLSGLVVGHSCSVYGECSSCELSSQVRCDESYDDLQKITKSACFLYTSSRARPYSAEYIKTSTCLINQFAQRQYAYLSYERVLSPASRVDLAHAH